MTCHKIRTHSHPGFSSHLGSLDSHLTVTCKSHPDTTNHLGHHRDFEAVRNGGCNVSFIIFSLQSWILIFFSFIARLQYVVGVWSCM